MPLYEYKCQNKWCREKIEIIKNSDKEDIYCPKCGTYMLKQISLSTFVLGKGSWYKNGYKG